MATKRLLAGSRSFVTLFDSGSLGAQTDRDLLECFQADPGPIGQEAFRILVERHGPMVLGLCRSLVRDQHEAEDAFQATFLVLVRKAASIDRRDTLGPWLYGVAAKVARRARNRLIDRRKREVPVAPDIPGRDCRAPDRLSAEGIVHEEIARLPDSFRKPLVLCCLQGLSYDLAAQQLGVNHATLRGRLERARKRLHSRLQRRGLPVLVGAGSSASLFAAPPPLPCSLVEATVQFSMQWSRLTGLLGGLTVVPQSIAALAQGVVQSMFLQTIRVSAAALLAVGAIGTFVVAQQGKGQPTGAAAPAAIARDGQDEPIKPQDEKIVDQPGAVTYVDYEEKEVLLSITKRMGARPQMKLSIRDAREKQLHLHTPKGIIEITSVDERTSKARIIKTTNANNPIRVGDIAFSPFWSPVGPTRFALLGKIDLNRDGNDDRNELKRLIQEGGGVIDFDLPPPEIDKESGKLTARIDWYVTDDRPALRDFPQQPNAVPPNTEAGFTDRVRAAVREARLSGIRPMPIAKLLAYLGLDENAKPVERPASGGPAAQAAKTPLPDANARIRQRLEMIVGADFPEVASLETLLKTIKKITTDDTYSGIPIYVDPAGIKDVKLTMESQVVEIPGQQPIRTVLSDSLRPLGLMYDVRDGFLMVSSRTAILEHRVEEIDRKLDRVIEMLGRLEQKN
jgi:RNA polymerase sigma factor (sigma-70 family)